MGIAAYYCGRVFVARRVRFLCRLCAGMGFQQVVLDLRNDMFKRLVQLPTTFFDNQSSGAVMSRIAYDVTGVTGAATGVLTILVKDTLAVVGLLSWMFYLNWMLSLIALVMIPAIALAVLSFSKRLRATSRGVQRAMGEIMHVLEESIEAHKVVKIFGGQFYEGTTVC
jgi:subfamily B ATP-binding cassette protein MsbA